MQIKKNPKFQMENFSKIFFELGLVLTLFIIYSLVEHKTYDNNDLQSLGEFTMTEDMKEDIPIVQIKTAPPPKQSPPVVEKIKIVEDELKVEETVIESTETDETDAVVVEIRDIVEIEETEEIEEDIPFIMIESVPVYPGCKGNNKQLRDCFTKKITKFFGKNFDPNISQELGLTSGKKRLYVVFRIDKKGNVVDVKARAPHPVLETKVKQIISSLPKMTPGKQREKPVAVSYSLPITFLVQE
ncbi:energy transducer TonB [Polaribacter sp.]|uniref:energy transducer TonB n=1 Tax=Polaribacter sp. TaxID=1920175 RepID=UPI003F6B2C36